MQTSNSAFNNSEQLDVLLSVKPSVATQSDTYANNVEQLAQNAVFTPPFMRKEEGASLNLVPGNHEEETYSPSKLEELEPLNTEDPYSDIEEMDLDENFYSDIFEEEEKRPDTEFGEYEKSLDDYRFPKEQETEFVLDTRSYSEKNLESELSKGVVEADLDRVEKLAEEVYRV